MINMLAYDVFIRKMLIEQLIDRYFSGSNQGKNPKKKKKEPPQDTE